MGPDDTTRAGTATLTGLDTETLPPVARAVVDGEPLVPGLTILCHPDVSRVGEQAHLHGLAAGRSSLVSRAEPDFRQPGEGRGRPLADPYLSRRPVELSWRGEALVVGGDVATRGVVVGGVVADAEVAVPAERLRRGVVVELGRRVALLLHLLPMPRRGSDDLGLVGASEAIEAVRREVRRVARTTVPVLLRGESGTGKELVARAIHDQSDRRAGPFVSVNMAAVPPTTAASDLFGHARGAYTGATTASDGLFGEAQGGTLFLDEIGDAPADVQVLLLRALESGEVQPVGAPTTRRADVRFVAATEADLGAAIEAGSFRAALLHRLAGYEIVLPPLRDRPDDVARLLVHFLRGELAALGQAHKLDRPRDRAGRAPLDPSEVARLAAYHWPGNVRQLRNVARHLAIGCQDADALVAGAQLDRLLPARVAAADAAPGAAASAASAADATSATASAPPSGPPRSPWEIGDEALVAALRAAGFRPGVAAERLGIGRTTIYKLIDACPAIRKAADLDDGELRDAWAACGGDAEAMAARLEVSVRALKLRLRRFEPAAGER